MKPPAHPFRNSASGHFRDVFSPADSETADLHVHTHTHTFWLQQAGLFTAQTLVWLRICKIYQSAPLSEPNLVSGVICRLIISDLRGFVLPRHLIAHRCQTQRSLCCCKPAADAALDEDTGGMLGHTYPGPH